MCLVLLTRVFPATATRSSEYVKDRAVQYTLIPPNFSLMRRANTAYPNQKPHARAMHSVVIQSQGCGLNGRSSPLSPEPPAAVTDMDDAPVSEVRKAGDPK